MRVDFYILTRATVDGVLPLIVRKASADGDRIVVAARDSGLRRSVSDALWRKWPESFLAHGEAGGAQDALQPVLIGEELAAPNGARLAIIADGEWREEASSFDRVFLLVAEQALPDARKVWSTLGQAEGVERRFWKQDERGKWVRRSLTALLAAGGIPR